jgi:Sensors of blue-light using FAD
MYHLVYVSYATAPFSETELVDMLQKFRINNKAKDITGMLLYLQERFIQVLEGDPTVVKRLYNKIEKDPRHKKVSIVLEGDSTERIFKNWSMGFKNLSLADYNELSGFQDMDTFFAKHGVTNESSAALIFLKLFYKKNLNDYPETIEY